MDEMRSQIRAAFEKEQAANPPAPSLRRGWSVPCRIGLTQSTWMPSPLRAPPCVKPAP